MWDGPYGEWGSRKNMIASCDQSLKRLGLDYVDIFYSHRFDPETPLEETMMALDYAVRSGKALYAGISNYNAEQTKEATEILKRLGTPCLIHQVKYSMFVRQPESGLLDVLEEKGVEVHLVLINDIQSYKITGTNNIYILEKKSKFENGVLKLLKSFPPTTLPK